MAGKPAARMGDTALDCADPLDTPTGLVVAKGTVFINKMPAAKQNDQIVGTDIHIIMIPSPTGPVPTPLPHPFSGLINGGTVPTVKIMGMPAAVVGSTATNMPPHIPQGGPFQIPPKNQAKIVVGSPNVFIGTGSGGSGGGGSGSVKGSTDGIFNHSFVTSDVESNGQEGHFLHATVLDSGDNWIMGEGRRLTDTEDKSDDSLLTGSVYRYRIPEGEGDLCLYDITRLTWSDTEDLKVGKSVALQMETVGIDDGEPVRFEVWERDTNQIDKLMAKIDTSRISGGRAEAKWTFPDELQTSDGKTSAKAVAADKPSLPSYYFKGAVRGIEKRSTILSYKDRTEFVLKCVHGRPFPHVEYTALLSTGQVQTGMTDSEGYVSIEKSSRRNIKVIFNGLKDRICECEQSHNDTITAAPIDMDAPTTTRGRVADGSLDGRVYNLEWHRLKANWGDIAELSARVRDVPNGAPATITVYAEGKDAAAIELETISATVEEQTIKAEWQVSHKDGAYESPTHCDLETLGIPRFFFTVTVGEQEYGIDGASGFLEMRFDFADLEIKFANCKPGTKVEITGPETRTGETDSHGTVNFHSLKPGDYSVKKL